MVSVLLNEQATKHIQDATPVQVIERQSYQSNLPPLPEPLCRPISRAFENSRGIKKVPVSCGFMAQQDMERPHLLISMLGRYLARGCGSDLGTILTLLSYPPFKKFP